MLRLTIKDTIVDISEVWYHYNDQGKEKYSLQISIDELEIIKIIERYADDSLISPGLIDKIKSKDSRKRSMGLFWQVQNELIDKKDVSSKPDCFWVINNIEDIRIEDKSVKIVGWASPYKG